MTETGQFSLKTLLILPIPFAVLGIFYRIIDPSSYVFATYILLMWPLLCVLLAGIGMAMVDGYDPDIGFGYFLGFGTIFFLCGGLIPLRDPSFVWFDYMKYGLVPLFWQLLHGVVIFNMIWR